MTDFINYEGVCRTAPATPGLLITERDCGYLVPVPVPVYKADIFDRSYNKYNFLINHNTLSTDGEYLVEGYSAFNVRRSGKISPLNYQDPAIFNYF